MMVNIKPGQMKIWEIYKIPKRNVIQKNLVQSWIQEEIIWKASSQIWERRKNLQGLHFRIGALFFAPVMYVKSKKSNEKSSGLYNDLFQTLSKEFNFTYSFVVPKDRYFGMKVKNGSWNGLVEMCARDEVDFGMPIRRSYLRAEYINFSTIVIDHRNTIVTRRRKANVNSVLSLMQPLTIFILVLILTTSILISFLIETYHYKKFTSETTLNCFGYLTMQGSADTDSQRIVSFKIITGTLLFFGLLFANTFSAQLSSHLR